MGVFETGRGRLVDHGNHVETGAAERFEGQEALRGVRVRRNADDDLQDLLGRFSRLADAGGHVEKEAGDEIQNRNLAIPESHRRLRIDVRRSKKSLE